MVPNIILSTLLAASFFLFLIFLVLFILKRESCSKTYVEVISVKERLNRKINELVFFQTLNKELRFSINLRKILDKILPLLINNFKFSAAAYFLFQNEKPLVRTFVTDNLSEVYLNSVKEKLISDYKETAGLSEFSLKVEDSSFGQQLVANGKSAFGSYLKCPLYIGEKKLVGLLCITSDKPSLYTQDDEIVLNQLAENVSTSVVKIQEIIDHEKRKIQLMLESMTDGLLMIDKDFNLLFINSAFYKLINRDVGTKIAIFEVTKYFSAGFPLDEKLAKVITMGETLVFSGIKAAGKIYQLILIPVRDESEIIGIGIILHDQTEEYQLKKLREEFTAMMVHELRSPLTVIKGTSDLLIKEQKNLDSDQTVSMLSQIKESAASLLNIVNDLLDAAKIDSGKVQITKKPYSLNKLLSDEGAYYLNMASQKQIKIILEPDNSIKNIDLDDKKIRQVMNNLLSNSIKFTDIGGEIKIGSKNFGMYVSVYVCDNGKGLSDEEKDKLFQKFAQAGNANETGENGTGLGLVVSKGIIEAHGGKIWIEDNIPKGAKFTFTLPPN